MPATVPPAGPVIEDGEREHHERRPLGRSRSIWLGGAAAVVVVGGLLLWLSAGSDTAPLTEDDAPVVKAAEAPVKVRPDDPGGMYVAHRDKLIYQRFEGDDATPVVERLLSAPEEPLPPPQSEPETAPPPGLATAEETSSPELSPEFMTAPPEETILAKPFEEFLEDDAPRAPSIVEAPSPSSSVAMVPPRPRPSAPPPPRPRSTLSAEARAAQSLLMGAESDGYAIQLGSVRSRQEANVEWERLRRSHADILGGLRLTVSEANLGNRGTYYRLRAGPITSQGSAGQLCSVLVDRKVACIVVQP